MASKGIDQKFLNGGAKPLNRADEVDDVSSTPENIYISATNISSYSGQFNLS